MLQSVNIRLPQPVFERLQRVAQRERRSLADTVDALVVQAEPFPSLRDEVEREMFALASFPNEVLVLLAQHPVPVESQIELANLDDQTQRYGSITEKDEERRAELLEAYQQGMLRRAYCLEILRRRNYDISDLLHLPEELVV